MLVYASVATDAAGVGLGDDSTSDELGGGLVLVEDGDVGDGEVDVARVLGCACVLVSYREYEKARQCGFKRCTARRKSRSSYNGRGSS